MSKKTRKTKEPKRWLDDSTNVGKIIRGFYFACGFVMLADFVFSIGWHKHAALGESSLMHGVEPLPFFYGIYGFLACVGLVHASKLMRSRKGKNVLMREEDYWDQ